MAKVLEDLRAQGEIDSYSADEAVGIAVNNLMFQQRRTRKELADAMDLSGPVVSRKIRGEVTWSILDVMRAAAFLSVDPAVLMPQTQNGTPPKHDKSAPAVQVDVGFFPGTAVVGRAGLEPATQGL